jgi:hypothetical protein
MRLQPESANKENNLISTTKNMLSTGEEEKDLLNIVDSNERRHQDIAK